MVPLGGVPYVEKKCWRNWGDFVKQHHGGRHFKRRGVPTLQDTIISSVIRQKGKSQDGSNKKTKQSKLHSRSLRSLHARSLHYTHVRVCIRDKKCSFNGKFGLLCFLVTFVLRFALVPNHRRCVGLNVRGEIQNIFQVSLKISSTLISCKFET